jgi:hypothetical protein
MRINPVDFVVSGEAATADERPERSQLPNGFVLSLTSWTSGEPECVDTHLPLHQGGLVIAALRLPSQSPRREELFVGGLGFAPSSYRPPRVVCTLSGYLLQAASTYSAIPQ